MAFPVHRTLVLFPFNDHAMSRWMSTVQAAVHEFSSIGERMRGLLHRQSETILRSIVDPSYLISFMRQSQTVKRKRKTLLLKTHLTNSTEWIENVMRPCSASMRPPLVKELRKHRVMGTTPRYYSRSLVALFEKGISNNWSPFDRTRVHKSQESYDSVEQKISIDERYLDI